MSIFSLILVLGLFMSMETFRGTIYRSEKATIVSVLQKARSRAMANVYQTPWSVCYIAPNYVIAKGASCTSATAFDKIEANPAVVTASNFASTFPTISFAQLTGDTAAATLTVVQDSRSSTISLNYEGAIIW